MFDEKGLIEQYDELVAQQNAVVEAKGRVEEVEAESSRRIMEVISAMAPRKAEVTKALIDNTVKFNAKKREVLKDIEKKAWSLVQMFVAVLKMKVAK